MSTARGGVEAFPFTQAHKDVVPQHLCGHSSARPCPHLPSGPSSKERPGGSVARFPVLVPQEMPSLWPTKGCMCFGDRHLLTTSADCQALAWESHRGAWLTGTTSAHQLPSLQMPVAGQWGSSGATPTLDGWLDGAVSAFVGELSMCLMD